MHRFSRPLIAATLVIAAGLPASAQTRSTWSIQGSALYTQLGGKANGGVGAGSGLELQGRRKINPLLSLGCGIQGTGHPLKNAIGSEKLRGIFCEPRRVVDVGSESVFPYVSGRMSILRRSLSTDTLSSSAIGTGLALGAGAVMPMSNTSGRFPMLFEMGASGGYTWFNSFKSDAGIKSGAGRGWNFIFRLGFAVGLPIGDGAK